ncbi:hypothetical protein Peur_006576 [Populus x canadensis]
MGFTTLPFSQNSYQWVMLGILLMILTLVVDENVSLHNEANKGMLHASHDIQCSLWFSLVCVWWAARKNKGFINASQFTLISTINDRGSMLFSFLAHVLSW